MGIKNQVVQLLEQGKSIIPVYNKQPVVKWLEYQDRLPTIEEWDKWLLNHKINGYAIITGKISNLTVIDIDLDKFEEDPSTLWNLYPTDCIVRTPGGYHLYYEYNESWNTNTGIAELYGADVRSDGGIIVGTGSIHPSGKSYEVVKSGAPSYLPTAPYKSTSKPTPNNQPTHLQQLLRGVEDGGRNTAATTLAGYLFKQKLPIDIIRQLLHNWNLNNKPPLPKQVINSTINSVSRYHDQDKTEQTSQLSLMNFKEYLTEYAQTDIQWTIPGWLPESTIAFMVAPPGSYKTWLLLDLAVSIAGGFDFLGKYTVPKSGPVIIFQQEDFHGQLIQRTLTILQSKITKAEGDIYVPEDLPIYFHPDRSLKLNNPDHLEQLEHMIQDIQPSLIIIDPLYSATSVDDYMSKTAEQMFPLKTFRDKYGVSFLVAHHAKKQKQGTGSPDRLDLWGSQFLNAFLETGLQIQKTAEDTIEIHRHFKVSGAVPLLSVQFDIHTDFPIKYEPHISAEEPSVVFDETTIIKYLHSRKGATLEQIVSKFDIHPDHLTKQLSLLIMSGKISESNGVYRTK